MIDTPFRKILPLYTKWVVATYEKLGVSPNQVTIGGFVLSCVAAGLVAGGFALTGVCIWWLSRLLDGTDGIYARAIGQTSKFGAFLDIVLDMAAYSIMIFGFYGLYPDMSFAWMLVLSLYVLCITSALALGSIEQHLLQVQKSNPEQPQISGGDNRGVRLATGLAEGGETGIAYSLFALFPEHIQPLVRCWVLILMVTVVARVMLARKLGTDSDGG